ncbi:MAG: TM2 domain-containing protein [Desulfuromonadales bacterium]|nr:TM2 domain-containing protein [Desulfuromonadales bacterium]
MHISPRASAGHKLYLQNRSSKKHKDHRHAPETNRLYPVNLRFYRAGHLDYTVAWILLTLLGLFGIHRMYMGKWISGLIYLLTGGIFGLGYLYDFWTPNSQISVLNRR